MTATELRAIRTKLGLSQPAMAARIGRSERRYRAYEQGECVIPVVVVGAVENLVRERRMPQMIDWTNAIRTDNSLSCKLVHTFPNGWRGVIVGVGSGIEGYVCFTDDGQASHGDGHFALENIKLRNA